jgi:hypothetical protein
MTWRKLLDEPECQGAVAVLYRTKQEKAQALGELVGFEDSVEMESCMACVDPARVVQAPYLADRLEREALPQ